MSTARVVVATPVNCGANEKFSLFELRPLKSAADNNESEDVVQDADRNTSRSSRVFPESGGPSFEDQAGFFERW